MSDASVKSLALTIAVIASTFVHPSSGKQGEDTQMLLTSIAVHACHVFFVLLVCIGVNNNICPCPSPDSEQQHWGMDMDSEQPMRGSSKGPKKRGSKNEKDY